MADFPVTFSKANGFPVKFGTNDKSFGLGFGQVQVVHGNGLPPYEGEYEVTPKVEAQTLNTAQKYMVQDLTVKEIPCYKVSNNAGGNTVYIAKEVN
jgi:hypothetical protein